MTPRDRYQLRCALLHEGSTLTDLKRRNDETCNQYTSFSFVEPGVVDGLEIHGVSEDPDRDMPGRKGKNLTLDVRELAAQTRDALSTWFGELQADPALNATVERSIHRLTRAQNKTLWLSLLTMPGLEGPIFTTMSSTAKLPK